MVGDTMALNDDILELIEKTKEESEQNRFRNSDEYEKLFDKVNAKSLLIDDIEKQLGCPSEIRCNLYEGQEIYDRTNRKCEITHLYKRDFMVKASLNKTFRILYKNYKTTWWLKEDRSE